MYKSQAKFGRHLSSFKQETEIKPRCYYTTPNKLRYKTVANKNTTQAWFT